MSKQIKNLKIRKIEARDNAKVAQMIRQVFLEFGAEQKGTVFSDPTTDTLFELFQNSASVFYLAVDEDRVLGSCGIYPTEGLPEGCAELVKFYLAKEARGQGIGRSLMEKSTTWAINKGYQQLYIESLPVFSKAVSIYQKQGFRQIDQPLSTSHPGCSLWYLKDL